MRYGCSEGPHTALPRSAQILTLNEVNMQSLLPKRCASLFPSSSGLPIRSNQASHRFRPQRGTLPAPNPCRQPIRLTALSPTSPRLTKRRPVSLTGLHTFRVAWP